MKRASVVGLVLVVIVGMAGCSAAQKGGALGAAAGALTGGLWASNAGILSTAEGALVGGASGGLGGMVVGDVIDQQEAQAAELAQAKAIENLEQQLAKASKDADDLRSQLAAAQQNAAGPADSAELAKTRNGLAVARARVRELEQALGQQKSQLAARERDLAERNKRLADAERMVAMRDDQLRKNQGMLKRQQTEQQRLQDRVGKLVKVARSGNTITLTFAGEVLFDSGKATIKPSGQQLLARVAKVLKENFPDNELNVEGHTDNVPIRYSGYRSNWELSAARAFSVLHYLADSRKIDGRRLSATAYGQTRPVASNATADGRRTNRRAVIVILPKKVKYNKQRLAIDGTKTADARARRTK